jgi:hypothetical protein
MKHLKLAISLALVFTGTLAMSAEKVITRHESPDLTQVEIKGVTMAGSGCVNGDGASVRFDGKALLIQSRELGAIAGREHRPAESRESCQFIVDLSSPSGWTYAVDQVSGKLTTNLGRGTTAQADFTTWFGAAGDEGKASLQVSRQGSSRSKSFEVDMDKLVYAPCGASRTLKVKIALQVSRETGSDTLAAADMKGSTTLNLIWKRCED